MYSPHTFHIPVMGTGFTIDTPLKVARYGISSVISLVDDRLIEKIRKHTCGVLGESYMPIREGEEDTRARRITAYLNLVHRQVLKQVEAVRTAPFEAGSEIEKYYELLDDGSLLKRRYLEMQGLAGGRQKEELQGWLRRNVTAGSIDVNIMTKVDRENPAGKALEPGLYSDALAALRGFALSDLESSVVFSAGLNLPLYGYVAEFADFLPDAAGKIKKKVILKVSDFRSAFVQAKMLAKKGVWVSEYRVESGLNCGGHAFPASGQLLGLILEEFKSRKKELIEMLFRLYRDSFSKRPGATCPATPPAVRVTAQGGVGTSAEHHFLLRYYELDAVGWGTPFLLVPEVTAVDDGTLSKLVAAQEEDIVLSRVSPLGIPFYTLRDSESETEKKRRVENGRPGSPCPSKYLAWNTEFGEPLCVASFRYQHQKINALKEKNLPPAEFDEACRGVVEKSCICRDLGDGVLMKYGIKDDKKTHTPAVCPGPNLSFFSKVSNLRDMVGHIYGRKNLLSATLSRPHVFLNELKLNINYLKELAGRFHRQHAKKDAFALAEFKTNLLEGVRYYEGLVREIAEESERSRSEFLEGLRRLSEEIQAIALPVSA